MTISYVGKGTLQTSTGNVNAAYPASCTSGNLLVLYCVVKDGTRTITTPSGWTAPSNNNASGGAGSEAVDDEGTVAVYAYHKTSDGTEGGTNQTATVSGSGPVSAQILQFSKTSDTWGVACANGSQNSGGSTSWSITMGSDPGIDNGDLVMVLSGVNGNLAGFSPSTHAVSASGCTFNTSSEIEDTGNPNGTDCRIAASSHPVTAGPSSGVATYTATMSTSATNHPAGASVLFRIRESAAGGGGALSVTSVDSDNEVYSAQADFNVVGTGFSLGQTFTIAGVACTELSLSSSTSIKLTAPNAISNNIKFGRAEFKVTD